MTTLPADKEITITHRGNTVCLRASLRAAVQLERLYDGFGPLFQKIEQFDTGTIRKVIQIAAIDKTAAQRFLSLSATTPLRTLSDATHSPLMALCAALLPAPSATPSATAKPTTWQAGFAELFRIATGWLGWSPETAWNAHPDEITEALKGHVAKLTLMNGGTLDDDTSEQRAENIAAGLDPDFNRAGLHALRSAL